MILKVIFFISSTTDAANPSKIFDHYILCMQKLKIVEGAIINNVTFSYFSHNSTNSSLTINERSQLCFQSQQLIIFISKYFNAHPMTKKLSWMNKLSDISVIVYSCRVKLFNKSVFLILAIFERAKSTFHTHINHLYYNPYTENLIMSKKGEINCGGVGRRMNSAHVRKLHNWLKINKFQYNENKSLKSFKHDFFHSLVRVNSCFIRSCWQTTHAGSDFPPPLLKTIEIQIFANFQRGINWLENGSWFECVKNIFA